MIRRQNEISFILSILLALSGCSIIGNGNADTYGVKVGDLVTLKSGFYKGCTGTITDYNDYNSIDDTIVLREVSCKNVTMSYLITEAKSLK